MGKYSETRAKYYQAHKEHDTDFVRGLLCRDHNRGLGFFKDNYELLERAAKWIFEGKVRYLNNEA